MDKEMLEAISQMMDTKLASVRNEMSQMMDAKLEPIRAELAEVKQGQKALERQQAEQTEFERGTRVLVENVNKNIRLLAEGHSANAAKLQQLDRMESTLNDIKSDTEVLKGIVTWHSEAIDRLKKV